VTAKKPSRTRVARTTLDNRRPAASPTSLEQQLRSPKTGELVADVLRRQIVRGELLVGDRLPSEEELTEHFGIARTTLREALRILESQGLIEIRRGRGGGPVVTMPRAESLAVSMGVLLQMQGITVGDLDRARAMVEPELAGEFVRHHTADDLVALEAAVADAAVAAKDGDRLAFASAVVAVHETIVERAGNATLALFSRLLHGLVEQYYRGSVSETDTALMQRAVRSHRKYLRLVEAGDSVGAEEHWRKHMAYTSERRDASAVLQLFEV
jgi:GntR family transcriptional regulator, transcriptional repressor for pyruvate dehydrogenase complex